MKNVLCFCCFLIVMSSLFIACERDDICAAETPTTPRLVIEFFEADNPGSTRNVSNLAVREVERDTAILFNGRSEIQVPLKTNAIETKFVFTLSALSETGGLTDTLTFSYAVDELYVNRACGFKANFVDFRARLGNSNNWIRSIQVRENIIEDETETHLFIFY